MAQEQTHTKLRAQIAANARWAVTADRAAATAKARQAALDRFDKLVDPDGVLSPEDRAKRAASARRAHMQKMALASAKARRGNRRAR